VEYRLRHRDGHYVHVWDQGIVERDGNGKALRLVGITADISERKAAEEQVRRSEVRLRRMMESSQVGIAFALASGEVLDCNNALLALLGYSRSEFEAGDLNWRQFSLPFDDAFNERLDREIRQTGYVAPHERFLLHKNGQRIPSMVSAALIDTESQSPNGGEHVAFVVDLSELKQAQVALQEINDTLEQRVALRTAELERSNRELDRFAYIASHDLKSPLRAIEHLSSWVAEDSAATLSPQSQLHLAKLRSRVKRLESLLDDLLLYSRAGRRRHAHEWVDTAEIVRSMVELLSPPPGFQVRVEGELPRLLCERPPFETVLRNLIENAIKHHNRPAAGAVVLSAQVRGDLFEFCVRDNGPGIDPQFHERVFEVFQTLRPRDEVEGSGMGLAIVKKIVENAGGAIRIESAAGQGAAFYFTWKQGEAAGG
jgi:PAS domain S-box-containing protein